MNANDWVTLIVNAMWCFTFLLIAAGFQASFDKRTKAKEKD